MTRKKYERDTYNDGFTTETSSSSEEEEEILDDETILNIIEYYWDPFKDQNIGDFVSYTDIFRFLYMPPGPTDYQHLLLPYESDNELRSMITRMCKDIKVERTPRRISQIVYGILHQRNKFCVIHRDDTHWTKRINMSIYKPVV